MQGRDGACWAEKHARDLSDLEPAWRMGLEAIFAPCQTRITIGGTCEKRVFLWVRADQPKLVGGGGGGPQQFGMSA